MSERRGRRESQTESIADYEIERIIVEFISLKPFFLFE